MNITAIVLCYNESKNIRHCLESVHGFCDTYIVDSGSTDDTLDICREFTSNIFGHKYRNHASQWQWALTNLPIETDWILALDADFVVTPALKDEVGRRLPDIVDGVDGIYVRHRYIFGGGPIRYGGTKRFWLRIVRTKEARADFSDLVDFRFIVAGKTLRFNSSVIEYNRYDDDISVWIKKQDMFSIRLAVEEELRRRRQLDWEKPPRFFGNPDERIMWLRNLWLSLPLFVRPFIYFFYRYILMIGFLDGRAGFLYHFLQGWWLRVLVDWKIMEIRKMHLNNTDLDMFKKEMLEMKEGSASFISKRLAHSLEANDKQNKI
jgi:glycosyltransferase involved in cell wall biosynthesis